MKNDKSCDDPQLSSFALNLPVFLFFIHNSSFFISVTEAEGNIHNSQRLPMLNSR